MFFLGNSYDNSVLSVQSFFTVYRHGFDRTSQFYFFCFRQCTKRRLVITNNKITINTSNSMFSNEICTIYFFSLSLSPSVLLHSLSRSLHMNRAQLSISCPFFFFFLFVSLFLVIGAIWIPFTKCNFLNFIADLYYRI